MVNLAFDRQEVHTVPPGGYQSPCTVIFHHQYTVSCVQLNIRRMPSRGSCCFLPRTHRVTSHNSYRPYLPLWRQRGPCLAPSSSFSFCFLHESSVCVCMCVYVCTCVRVHASHPSFEQVPRVIDGTDGTSPPTARTGKGGSTV